MKGKRIYDKKQSKNKNKLYVKEFEAIIIGYQKVDKAIMTTFKLKVTYNKKWASIKETGIITAELSYE